MSISLDREGASPGRRPSTVKGGPVNLIGRKECWYLAEEAYRKSFYNPFWVGLVSIHLPRSNKKIVSLYLYRDLTDRKNAGSSPKVCIR